MGDDLEETSQEKASDRLVHREGRSAVCAAQRARNPKIQRTGALTRERFGVAQKVPGLAASW